MSLKVTLMSTQTLKFNCEPVIRVSHDHLPYFVLPERTLVLANLDLNLSDICVYRFVLLAAQ